MNFSDVPQPPQVIVEFSMLITVAISSPFVTLNSEPQFEQHSFSLLSHEKNIGESQLRHLIVKIEPGESGTLFFNI